jgi:CBS domain-containing protein
MEEVMAETKTVREVMTPDPVVLEATATVREAARAMKEYDVGDVLVSSGGKLRGIVTDRDLVLRALASDDEQVATRKLGEICTDEVETLAPEVAVEEAIALMRDRAIRRVPIVERGRAVGIISLGDLAVDRDPESVLGEISAAPPSS